MAGGERRAAAANRQILAVVILSHPSPYQTPGPIVVQIIPLLLPFLNLPSQ